MPLPEGYTQIMVPDEAIAMRDAHAKATGLRLPAAALDLIRRGFYLSRRARVRKSARAGESTHTKQRNGE